MAAQERGLPRGPRRQHVVSQVLLRRFTDPVRRHLIVFDLVTGRERESSPNNTAYVKDFITVDAASAESRWSEVESELPGALAALDDGSLLERPDLVNVVKDCVALHWARSKTAQSVHERAWSNAKQQSTLRLLGDKEELARIFRDRYGLEPAGPGALLAVAEDVQAHVRKRLDDDDIFGQHVREAFDDTRARVAARALQIGEAADGELCIGDAPAQSLRRGPSGVRVGPLGGVPWSDADTIVLPLGPRHVAALSSTAEWLPLSSPAVDLMNHIQMAAAHREVYFRPGSGLSTTVAARRNQVLAVES